jgi:hypothetical protein
MTDHDQPARNSPAWQRYRAARTLAHHTIDVADLAQLLDMLGLAAIEGSAPAREQPAPAPVVHAVTLDEGSAGRLSDLLREVHPRGHRRAG